MKIGNIIEPNSKGQIVIPKQIRDDLNIIPGKPLNIVIRGGGIYLYPIESVNTKIEEENSFLEILKNTQGAWAGDDWARTERRRQKIEKQATIKNRRAW